MMVPNSLMFSNLKYCGIITDQYVLNVNNINNSNFDVFFINM